MAGTAIAAAAAAFSIKSSVDARREADKARRTQRKAAQVEQRKTAIINARERRKAVAQARIRQAQLQAREAATGAESTGVGGQLDAINSQLGSSLSFQRGIESANTLQTGLLNTANRFTGRSQAASARAALPGQLGLGAAGLFTSGGLSALSSGLGSAANTLTGGRLTFPGQ